LRAHTLGRRGSAGAMAGIGVGRAELGTFPAEAQIPLAMLLVFGSAKLMAEAGALIGPGVLGWIATPRRTRRDRFGGARRRRCEGCGRGQDPLAGQDVPARLGIDKEAQAVQERGGAGRSGRPRLRAS
jgi:hypothetical protein